MGRRTAQRRDETGDGARARIGTVLLATVIAAAAALGGAAPARSTIVDGAIGAPPHSAFLRSAQRSLMPIVPNVRVIAGEAGVAACEAGRRTAGAGVPEAGIAACADYPDTIVFSTARSGPDAPRVSSTSSDICGTGRSSPTATASRSPASAVRARGVPGSTTPTPSGRSTRSSRRATRSAPSTLASGWPSTRPATGSASRHANTDRPAGSCAARRVRNRAPRRRQGGELGWPGP